MIAIRSTSVILLSTWILTAVVATNYSLMFAFFAEYSESRHIPIEKYSYVFGIGDGAYIIGVFLYPLVSNKTQFENCKHCITYNRYI